MRRLGVGNIHDNKWLWPFSWMWFPVFTDHPPSSRIGVRFGQPTKREELMSRVALLVSVVSLPCLVLIASDCSKAHVRSMEENNICVEYYQKKLYPQAVDHLNRAITLDSNNEQAHFNLAQVYIATSQWQDAATHLQNAIALNDKVADYHYKLG